MLETVPDDVVVSSGKIIFQEDGLHVLPEMDVIIFSHPENEIYSYTAVCIQLELDVCGNSVEEVTHDIVGAVKRYLEAVNRDCESFEKSVQTIIDIFFSKSKQKDNLFEILRNSKQEYLKSVVKQNKGQLFRSEAYLDPSFKDVQPALVLT
jgi:hypothetical protein